MYEIKENAANTATIATTIINETVMAMVAETENPPAGTGGAMGRIQF